MEPDEPKEKRVEKLVQDHNSAGKNWNICSVHSARIPISMIRELIDQDDVEIPGDSASSDGIIEEPSSGSLRQKGHLWMHLDKDEGKYSSHGIILDQILSKNFDNGDPDLDDLDQDDPDPQVHDLHNQEQVHNDNEKINTHALVCNNPDINDKKKKKTFSSQHDQTRMGAGLNCFE